MTAIYITILNRELERRRERNPSYSLRAFASFLGLDSSALSRVLNAKQELSVRAAAHLVRKLRLSQVDQERFVVSVARTRYNRLLAELSEGADGMSVKAALRASEERFRVLFERVDQMISLIELVRDDEGRVIDFVLLRVNPAWERQTSMKGEDVVGRRATEYLPNMEPYWLELYERVKRTRAPERQEYFVADLNAWYEVYAESTEDDRLMVLGRNITERKRLEQELHQCKLRLTAITNQVPDLLWVSEADGRVTWRNQRFRDYLGADGDLPTATWDGAIHPDEHERATETYRRALADEEIFTAEYRLRAADGSFRWFLLRAEPFLDQDTRSWQMYGAATDIDHLRR